MDKTFAKHCDLKEQSHQQIILQLSPQYSALLNQALQQRLETAINDYLGKKMNITILLDAATTDTPAIREADEQKVKQANAYVQIEQDPNIQIFIQEFDAKIIPDSVIAIDNPDVK